MSAWTHSPRAYRQRAGHRCGATVMGRSVVVSKSSLTWVWLRILPSDATDFDQPFLVEAEFELDPVVNVPGPSAMGIPTGVAPGKFKDMVGFKPPLERRFPAVCGSYRHQEHIELAFLPGAKIQRIPKGVRFWINIRIFLLLTSQSVQFFKI
jgi:hypothetical protein